MNDRGPGIEDLNEERADHVAVVNLPREGCALPLEGNGWVGGKSRDHRPGSLDRGVGGGGDGGVAHRRAIVVPARRVGIPAFEVEVGNEVGLIARQFLVVVSRNLGRAAGLVPDPHLVNEPVEVLGIEARANSVIGVSHVDVGTGPRTAQRSAVPVPA